MQRYGFVTGDGDLQAIADVNRVRGEWGRYPVEVWERLQVELVSGRQQVLYRYWWLYEEEYGCDVGTEPPSLLGF